MTKELLESYRSKKEEIKELQYKLEHLCDGDAMIGNDTIFDYRSGYPMPQAVVGVNWKRVDRTERRYKDRIAILIDDCEEIEEFIESISDSLTRRIYRMYYLDGLSQCKIAKQVHMSQASISEKISFFLNSDKNDKKV